MGIQSHERKGEILRINLNNIDLSKVFTLESYGVGETASSCKYPQFLTTQPSLDKFTIFTVKHN